MRKLVTVNLIGLLLVAPLSAQEPVRGEREHTVRTGDTLWDLAELYLHDPFEWPSIYNANRLVVEDPHWIYPNEVLAIPGIGRADDAVARVARASSAPPLGVQLAANRRVLAGDRAPVRRPVPGSDQRSDQEPTVVREPVVPVVPVTPGEFTTAPYVIDLGALDVRGRFLRTTRAGRGIPASAHPKDRVLLTHDAGAAPRVGERLALLRVGRRLDGSRVIHPTGIVRVWGYQDGIIEGRVEGQFGPIYPDQLVIPLEAAPELAGLEAAPMDGADLHGSILAFVDEQPLYGLKALALLDLGSRDGVQVGDVFQVYLPEGARVRAERRALSPEREPSVSALVARLRVVRVTEAYATAKVEQLVQPLLDERLPVRRVGAMP